MTVPGQSSDERGGVGGGALHCASMLPSDLDPPEVKVEIAVSKTDPRVTDLRETGPETRSMYSLNSKPESTTAEERFLATLVTPKLAVSKEGLVEFKELYIPPPVAPQLETVITKATAAAKKAPLLTHSSSMFLSGRRSPRTTPIGSPRLPHHAPSPSPKHPPAPPSTGTIVESNSGSSSNNSGNVKKRSPSNSSSRLKKSPIAKGKTDKEKLLHIKREKYCAPGYL